MRPHAAAHVRPGSGYSSRMNWRRLVKLLHELGAVGVMGAAAAMLVLVWSAPSAQEALPQYAAVRQGIAMVSKWVLVPSLAIVLVSGLLSIMLSDAFVNAGWVWLKAGLGIVMFEGTLLTVGASARKAAEISALAAAGNADPARLAEVLRTEWGGLWMVLALSFANIVLAVWRPRFHRTRPPASA